MKKLKYALLFVFLAMFLVTCNKDDIEIKDPDPQPTGNFTTTDVKITLPEGVNIDLSKTKIISFGEEFNVSADGSAKPFVFEQERNLVYLADENENIVLVAFISNTEKDISVRSSAKVSLFFSLGTVFQFPEIIELYFKGYDKLSEMDKFYEDINVLFKANINFLETPGFQTLLKTKTKELIGEKQIIDISTKSIDISDFEYKGGVRIFEEKINKIGFENKYRRRTHAFVYKIASKKEGEQEFTYEHVPGCVVTETPYSQKKIETPGGTNSVLGTGVSYFTGEATKTFIAKTDPFELKLEEGETEAKYLVRVIGATYPGKGDSHLLTSTEQEKFADLQFETFIFDLLLPITAIAAGNVPFSIDGIDENLLEGYKATASIILESVPSAKKALFEENDPLKALLNITKDALITNINGYRDLLIDEVIRFKKAKNPKFEPGKLKNQGTFLKYTDLLLEAQDLIQIVYGNCSSNAVEEWEVIVKRAQVLL